MPLLIDTETRADALVRSINHVLIDHGPAGLTLRRIAGYSASARPRCSTTSGAGSIYCESLRTGPHASGCGRWTRRVRWRESCVPPRHGEELLDTRAWLAWLELWRVEDSLEAQCARRADERALLARLADFQLARHDLDELFALIDGLRVAVCAPARPMRLEVVAEILAARCPPCPARKSSSSTPHRGGRDEHDREQRHQQHGLQQARVPLEHPGSLLAAR